MRVLVIGGTSFMGPYVVRNLVSAGHTVTVFHRGNTEGDLPTGVAHIHAPGLNHDLDAFRGELERLQPDVTLHSFLMVEAEAQIAQEALRGLTGRLVVLSSMDVYRAYGRLIGTEPGPPDPMPVAEDGPLREKRYPYRGAKPRPPEDPQRWVDDYDKIPVEQLVLSDPELPGTVLRLPMVYGEGDRQHRLFPYLKRMDDGRPAILLGEAEARWRMSRGYVENVAAGITGAVLDSRAAGQIYNISEPTALPEAEWVRRIGRAAGWKGRVVVLPEKKLPAHLKSDSNNTHNLEADVQRAERELGFREPVPQEVALERTVAWERAHLPEKIEPMQFDYAAEDAALAS